MSWKHDFAWSNRFIPAIKRIVGPHLLEPAPMEKDEQQATDLVVIQAKNLSIACRVRRPGYAERYPYEFTIRNKRDSGTKTELDKLIDGFGDWMFYGHSNADEDDVCRWMLLNLDVWRSALIRRDHRNNLVFSRQNNGDGTHFVAFDVRSFPVAPPLIIATSHQVLTLDRAV